MQRKTHKQEYIENYDVITGLYDSGRGMTLVEIHKMLTAEGVVTSSYEVFKNLHSALTPEVIAELRLDAEKITQHKADFAKVTKCISELLQTGLSFSRIYIALRKSDQIKMSLSFFRTLGIDSGVYKPRSADQKDIRPTEVEFLNQKENIIKLIGEGRKASKVYQDLYENEKLSMSFSSFHNYCMKHGVEIKTRNTGTK